MFRGSKKVLFMVVAAAALCAAAPAVAGGGSPPPQGAKYPFLIAHGGFGTNEFLGIQTYFGVAGAMAEDGHKFYAVELSAAAPTYIRGPQFIDQVEEVLAITGAQKANIIGHSLGGMDARYVAHVMGASKIASCTTLATPHRGMPSSDLGIQLLDGILGWNDLDKKIADAVGWVIGAIANLGDDLPQSGYDAIVQATTWYMAEWNTIITNAPGVYYESWGGSQVLTNVLDPVDYGMLLTSVLYFGEPNDGIVSVSSAGWGNVRNLRLPANHLDFANQVLGLTSWRFDALEFFKDHAAGMKARGF